MSRPAERVFVTGASGFVGGNIVDALAEVPLRLLTHRSEWSLPERSNDETVTGDVTNPKSLAGALNGCDTVIHLVGIIEESGNATFDAVIRQGTENVVQAAQHAGVRRFIHMSANGARNDPNYRYLDAKWQAEQAVIDSEMSWTIFRPSVIFGEGDGFFTTLAGVVRTFPILPVAGDGQARMQPVHVRDVADAFARAVSDEQLTANRKFYLGGPRAYTYDELLDTVAAELGDTRSKIHIPLPIMNGIVRMSTPLPRRLRPPVTWEQLRMLSIDNTTPESATAELIGRDPAAVEGSIAYLGG